MTNQKKAASYEKAKAALDSHLAKTGQTLSIRKLKAVCGGAGSNETYQQYLIRWGKERQEASGLTATLMSIKNQAASHAAIMTSLVEQALLQIGMSGSCENGLDHEDYQDDDLEVDDTDDAHGGEPVRQTDRPKSPGDDVGSANEVTPTAPSSAEANTPQNDGPTLEPAEADITVRQTRSDEEIEALARDFADNSEPRFHDAAEDPQEDRWDISHGESAESRSAPVPIAHDPETNDEASLSRSDGGGQQTTLPLEPTKPETGESDTTGGSANGTA